MPQEMYAPPFGYAEYVRAYSDNPDRARSTFRHDLMSWESNPYVQVQRADEETRRFLENQLIAQQIGDMDAKSGLVRQQTVNMSDPLYGRTDFGADIQRSGISPSVWEETNNPSIPRKRIPNPAYSDAVGRNEFAQRGTTPELESYGQQLRATASPIGMMADLPPAPAVTFGGGAPAVSAPKPTPQPTQGGKMLTREQVIQALMQRKGLTRGQAEARVPR